MITCTRRLYFCAGHRILGHENKCAHLHGHNYSAYITAEPKHKMDEIGRVIDFSVLKEMVGGWIEAHWDHGFLINKDDEVLIEVFKGLTLLDDEQKLYVLPYNPTAENLARHLLTSVCPQVLSGLDIVVTRVTVEETENCEAEASI